MREPLFLPAAILALGILVGSLVTLPMAMILLFTGLTGLALVASIRFRLAAPVKITAILCLFLACGVAIQAFHRQTHRPELSVGDGEAALLTGCVVNPPVFSQNREQFTLDIAPHAGARISVNLKGNETLPLQYGQQVEVAAKVRSPRNFGNPDAFDYAGYLANQKIYWTGSVSSIGDVRVLPERCGSRAIGWLFAVRTWALARLVALYPGDPHTAALLQATLLGETSGVERRWTSDFRITGTYHALVISGQHVSVLAFTLLFLLRILHVRRFPALCMATVACWLYAFISGLSSPVVRAAGGFTLFLIASYLFRKTRVLNILGAIALVYLLFAPNELYDPSFQLSFLSAAAIAAFALPLMERYTEPLRASVKRFDQPGYDPMVEGRAAQWRVELRLLAATIRIWTGLSEQATNVATPILVKTAAFITEAVLVSACVQFGLALPMVSYFHRLSITGLSANIVVIPVLSLVIPTGFAALFTMWHPLALVTKLLLGLAEAIAAWHVRFEPSWRMGAIPLAVSLSFVVSLLVLAWSIRHARRYVAVPLASALLLFATLCIQPWPPLLHPNRLEVTAIDVGQGDAIFIGFPDGKTMLVDAGGFPGFGNMKRKPQMDIGEDVVSPYLWSRRIRHLDYAVLTHGHSDHMGGLAAILDNFRPQALWIGAEPGSEEWSVIEQHAAADHVAIRPLTRAATPLTFGGATVRVLAPSIDYVPGKAPGNNDSLVLEIRYGKRSVLLTGDAELPVEEELVAAAQLQQVTLLKVGHHGSKTSSGEDLLTQLQPQFAFISDGYKNQFHHPHPSVLARLNEHHVQIRRTDEQGLSTFLSDGDSVQVSSFR